MMVAETDIAYLAGLFDGEGNIQYKQYMRQRRNNEKPLEECRKVCGISTTQKTMKN